MFIPRKRTMAIVGIGAIAWALGSTAFGGINDTGPANRTSVDAIASQDMVIRDDQPAAAPVRTTQFLFWPFWQQPQQNAQPGHRRRSYDSVERTEHARHPPSTARRQPAGSFTKDRVLAQLRDPPEIPETKGPLLLTVSVAKQTVTLFDGGVEIAKAPVSTGTEQRPTPMGVFSVVEKSWWHRSNMYSAAPMPFMQRITWSGVALHAGDLPGYRASHGCVRLPESFALRLWYTTRVGARVIIAWDEVTPLEIAHPLLFQPKQPGQPPAPPVPRSPPNHDVVGMVTAMAGPSQDDPRDNADIFAGPPVAMDVTRDDDDAALDHMTMATADDQDTDQPTRQADTLLALERDLPVTLASFTAFDSAHPRARPDGFAVARRRVRQAAEQPPEPTSDVVPVLRPGAVSVLISRRDHRVYVRKGLQPIFDAPVAVTQDERPLGTHVFTAVAAADDTSKLRWTVVSPSAEPHGRNAAASTAAASAALDRITLAQDAADRIAELTSVGATLIVSDARIGRSAQALDSDFTVLMR
jgi:lipoprotein-anchoring transpeptidase ErfK/SrfK